MTAKRCYLEADVVEALASAYNESSSVAVIVARLCDRMLDPSGALLGYVRAAAMRLAAEARAGTPPA